MSLGKDNDGNYYFIYGGYGSCSYCDALQAARDKSHKALRDDLRRKVRKFDSLSEFETWFNDAGRLEFWNKPDVKDFIKKVKKELNIQLVWCEGK